MVVRDLLTKRCSDPCDWAPRVQRAHERSAAASPWGRARRGPRNNRLPQRQPHRSRQPGQTGDDLTDGIEGITGRHVVALRLCTETLANLCKNDIVVFPERPRPALPMKLSSAAATLQLAGYKPAKVVGERHLDAAQAQRMSCPDCGAHGLRYNSYEHPSGSSHRGLAWCPECLTTVEL